MTELVKQAFLRFVLPLLVPLLIGLGSAVITSREMNASLDSRVTTLEDKAKSLDPLSHKMERLETTIERHEKALDRDFLRHEQIVSALASKTEDQERRITLLEAHFGETQHLLDEIRADVKVLLRGGVQ